MATLFFLFPFRLTVIPGPPLFSLTVQLPDPFPRRVESIEDTQNPQNQNSTVRAETVLRETLLGQFVLPMYCGQRNSTKFASTPMSLPQGLCAED